MTGAAPNNPPSSTQSPTALPTAGMRRAPVVFELIMPIAMTSAIVPASASREVSPGTTIMSSPSEQTAVIASSFSIDSTPSAAARAMPASSLTGMKAPDSPPVDEVAMMPPFLTASFSKARAAVVPGAPARARPMLSRMSATESPTAGEGASERSMMPTWASSISAASRATSSPTRVILKVVRLTRSARSVNDRSG